jgi:hypothetical protein
MAYCTECGKLANSDAKFCSACGRPLSADRPGLDGPPEDMTESEPDSVLLEALTIAPEIMDTEAFYKVCQNRPDEALRKISTLEQGTPELGETFPVPLFKFVALGHKAIMAYESNGNQPDAHVLGLCSECLRAYAHAETASKAANAENLIREPSVMESLDAISILVEKGEPGGVQQQLSQTKLKYAAFANRVDISNAVQNALTNDELREALEFPVTAPFIIRAALFGTVMDVGNAKMLSIMLYEQTEVWDQSEKMNPIKGQLHLRKEKSAGSHWTLF